MSQETISASFVGVSSNSYPTGRRGHSMVLYNDTLLVIFGGRYLSQQSATYVNVTNLIQTDPFVASNIQSTSLVNCSSLNYCNLRGSCILPTNSSVYPQIRCECIDGYNGYQCEKQEIEYYLHDLWIFNIQNLTNIANKPDLHYQSFDSNSLQSIGLALKFFNSFQTENYPWILFRSDPPGTQNPVLWPEPRYFHSSVIIDNKFLVYGGYSQLCQDYCTPVWEYSFLESDNRGRGVWRKYTQNNDGPGGRWRHVAVANGEYMYIFGGQPSFNSSSDVYNRNQK